MSSASAGLTGPEQAALRKVAYGLAELNGDDVDPTETSLVEAAKDGMENLNDLVREVENLRAEVEVLEQRAPEPSKMDYDQMDKADKVTVVRQKLKKQAEGTNGRAAVTYKDVVRMFDGHPSAGHAYDLMETAATDDDYSYGESPNGEKRLTYTVKPQE